MREDLIEAVHEIAQDQKARFKNAWSEEERVWLLKELRRINLDVDVEWLWSGYYHACERGGEFCPPMNTFIADLRYVRRRAVEWHKIPSAATGVLPKPQSQDSMEALQAYLDGIHADSLHEAVEIEAEAQRRGVWSNPATAATGAYHTYDWVPAWKKEVAAE